MLQQLNTRENNDRSIRESQTINVFPNLNLERLSQFLKYGLIAVLIIAYLIVTLASFIQGHPMSTFLIMPVAIVLLMASIQFLSKSKN